MKKAFITGITGQDGSYLAEFLLEKGYQVHGMVRRVALEDPEHRLWRIRHIFDKLVLHSASLESYASIFNVIEKVKPDECYHLAAQSFVSYSFEDEFSTINININGTHSMLSAIKQSVPKCKFYFAASSEMFGQVKESPQNENTPFHPRSPYGISKVAGFDLTRNYREAYKMFAISGILFNHESPRRGYEFVTRKITHSAAQIKLGLAKELKLGNLEAKRDWGYAKDYCIDLGTAILTEEGFKYYNEIKVNDIVLNYNIKTNRLEKDRIIKKILIRNKGKMYIFQGRGLKLRCSTNHRIYYQRKSKTSKGGWSDWKICEAQDFYKMLKDLKLRTKYDFRLPHTQGYKNKDLKIKDGWFKLIGYLLSEGSLYDGNRNLRISVSQSKLIHKKVHSDIKCCLKNLNLVYSTRERSNGVVEFIFNRNSSKKIISYFDGFDIHQMPKWIYKVGDRQLKLLLKAMMDGDGCWGTMTYVSRRKDLVFSFQTIATILGYRTIINQRKSGMWECVLVALRKKYAYILDCKEKNSNEGVWCITTKNGTIVTNKDGGITVSGNCKAMWLMLQQDKPDDYVIATGETHSVKEFVELAFSYVGLNWKDYVVVDKIHYRPAEVYELRGDFSKARERLKWQATVKFEELVKMMVDADLKRLKSNKI